MASDRHAALIGELEVLVSATAAEAGVELVELSLRGGSKRRFLRVAIDRAGPRGVGLEDCQRVSKRLGVLLHESDLIPASYVLEVSSPGLDRPIRTTDDIRRNIGRRVVVRTLEPIEGCSEFRGVLLGESEHRLCLRDESNQRHELPLEQVGNVVQEVGF